LASAEVYDPATGTWSRAEDMQTPRLTHTATLLPGGSVLIAGGGTGYPGGWPRLTSAELFDPVHRTWHAAGSLNDARGEHTATLLPDGSVLVVGGLTIVGEEEGASYYALETTEVYDIASKTWMRAAPLQIGRGGHTATLLANGDVLVAAGFNIV